MRSSAHSSIAGVVYDVWTQNLSIVAHIPEQIGTTTMDFSKVSGGTYKRICIGEVPE